MNAHFTRMSEAGLQEMDARFYTAVHTLTHMDFLDIPDLTAPIDRMIATRRVLLYFLYRNTEEA